MFLVVLFLANQPPPPLSCWKKMRAPPFLKSWIRHWVSQRHRHFVEFFNVPVQAPTRGHPFKRLFREIAHLVIFYGHAGIRRAHSRFIPRVLTGDPYIYSTMNWQLQCNAVPRVLSRVCLFQANPQGSFTYIPYWHIYAPPFQRYKHWASACKEYFKFYGRLSLKASKFSVLKLFDIVIFVGLLHHPFSLQLVLARFGHLLSTFENTFWLRITDEGSVPEMRIWSILLIKSDLKWCIYLSRSLFLYLLTLKVQYRKCCLWLMRKFKLYDWTWV